MTPERWALVKKLFADAIELPAADRAAFLTRACAGDSELHDEVASLLASAEGSDSLPGARVAVASVAAQALGLGAGPRASLGAPDLSLQHLLESALGQQYEIVRPLGHGGMGAVYLARERSLERFVAIKVLRPDLADEREGRERFRREARIAAQLSHPNILPLHTFGEVAGLWYFVMGYVPGVTLAERLRVEGRLDPAEAHRILCELADALECAHRSGVVHRDIKPANVLLDEATGRAVLADFGVARIEGASDSLTRSGMVIGTPSFMSPEQALGAAAVDERSDIYSLGAVGYAMLAGREPFAGVRTAALTRRRLVEDAPPLRVAVPEVPPALAEVIARCLAREPGERWPNARALRAALSAAADDGGEIPAALRDLPAFGPYALLWAALWLGLASQPERSLGDRALLLLVGASVPVGLVLHVLGSGAEGTTPAQLARAAFWPPEWWGMWWPRSLRRPTDLWPRLPWPARSSRVALSALLVALPALILGRQWMEALAGGDAPPGWFDAVQRALVLACVAVVLAAFAWARTRRLSARQAARLLLGATSPGRGWSEPAIDQLLATNAGRVRAPRRDSPTDHRRAIGELLRRMPPAHAPLAAQVAEQVERVLASIERADAQLAVLASHASSTEIDRLAAQLDLLESESPNAPDHAERAELAGLVRAQLDVVRRMRVNAELMAQERGRLMRSLRSTWTRLATEREEERGQALVACMEETKE